MIKRSILFTSSAAIALAVSCAHSQTIAQCYDRRYEEKPFLKKERSRAINLVELRRLSELLTLAARRQADPPGHLLPGRRARCSVLRSYSFYQGAF